MNALKQRWQVWALRIDAMSFRERVLVFLAVSGVILALLFVGLIEPALKQQELALQSISGLQQEIYSLRETLDSSQRQKLDGDGSELARLREAAVSIERDVSSRERRMIPPDRMVLLLKAMIADQPGVSLLSLETGEVHAVEDSTATPEVAAAPTHPPVKPLYYKHSVTLRLTGSYAHLTEYLERLEGLPWTMQWSAVKVDASKHPLLLMTLQVATMSREPTWARL